MHAILHKQLYAPIAKQCDQLNFHTLDLDLEVLGSSQLQCVFYLFEIFFY